MASPSPPRRGGPQPSGESEPGLGCPVTKSLAHHSGRLSRPARIRLPWLMLSQLSELD